MASLAERFFERFRGLDRVHGLYEVPQDAVANGKKVEGRASTRATGPTVALVEAHLEGRIGLGVVPIRDDATCRFGAIDVDIYDLNLDKLAKDIESLKLPLLPCRTKSGGAHCYLFGSEDLPAELVRAKLMEWAVALGHPGVEIFPKQASLAGEHDRGSWINLPYQSGARSLRYCFSTAGAMSPEEFLDAADRIAVTGDRLKAWRAPVQESLGGLFDGGPPCLQTLAMHGFPEGTRNNGLFNVAVYVKKRWPDDWEGRVDQYNQKFMDPPLGHADVQAIVKSARKKDYSYRCKDQPIVGVCNKAICLERDHGIGGKSDDPGVTFGALIKRETEPPTWLWDVNGHRVEFTTEDLLDQRLFRKRVLERLTILVHLVRPQAWSKLLQERLDKVEVEKVTEDLTPTGELQHYLEEFCGGRGKAKTKDELLMGKPWHDGDTIALRAPDLLKYLKERRMTDVTTKKLYGHLRELGATPDFEVIKGKGTRYWRVPEAAVERQTQPYDIPRAPKEGQF